MVPSIFVSPRPQTLECRLLAPPCALRIAGRGSLMRFHPSRPRHLHWPLPRPGLPLLCPQERAERVWVAAASAAHKSWADKLGMALKRLRTAQFPKCGGMTNTQEVLRCQNEVNGLKVLFPRPLRPSLYLNSHSRARALPRRARAVRCASLFPLFFCCDFCVLPTFQ